MKDVVQKLFGKKIMDVINKSLDEYVLLQFDEKDIEKSLKDINESIRTCMYLVALDRKDYDLAYKIDKANKILKIKKVEAFEKAYNEGNVKEFLSTMSKIDKISLLSDLDLDVSLEERTKMPKKKRDYFKIVSESIMNDQESDNRDGYDDFIKYKGE